MYSEESPIRHFCRYRYVYRFYRFEECGHHYCQCGYFRAARQVYTSQHPGAHQHPALRLSDGEKSEGSLFIAIIISTLIGIPMGVTQFSDNWMPVSTPHSIAPIFCQFDFTGFFTPKMFMVVFSLLLVNIFDTIGTVLGLVSKLGVKENEKGEIPGVKEAMMSDAIGTTAGALLGSSTITTYVESASGVAEGGKSGLTSFFVGLMFILSIFLAPIFLLIPSAATSGALVMVGVLMIDSFKKIELEDISESFPAFITMITMVLCYSIADGICLGILSYVLIKMMVGKFKDLNPTLYILSIFLLFNYVFG